PVTAVVIHDLAELANSGAMDMATEDRVHVIALCVVRDSSFEFADEADCVFHTAFCVGAKRPVPETEPSSHEIDKRIQREQKLIANVTGEREPLHVLNHSIQFVSVND